MTTLAWTTPTPALHRAPYLSVRAAMSPGDIVAFAGTGFVSQAIQWVTRCPISHVGIIRRCTDTEGVRRVQVMEATSLDGMAGVQPTWLSDRVLHYTGRIYWLRLAPIQRLTLNECALSAALDALVGRKYDFRQVAHFYFDRLDLWSQNEDTSRLFCSELAAVGLKAAHVLPSWVNASEVRPSDLVAFRIYANDYYQLRGPAAEIACFNRTPLTDWRKK